MVAQTATHFASYQCENTVFPHLWERKAKQPRGHATQQQQRLLLSLNRLKARSVKRLLFESVKCLNKGNNHFYKSHPVVALGKCVTHPISLQQAPLKQGNPPLTDYRKEETNVLDVSEASCLKRLHVEHPGKYNPIIICSCFPSLNHEQVSWQQWTHKVYKSYSHARFPQDARGDSKQTPCFTGSRISRWVQ